jgi:hypothetical protein
VSTNLVSPVAVTVPTAALVNVDTDAITVVIGNTTTPLSTAVAVTLYDAITPSPTPPATAAAAAPVNVVVRSNVSVAVVGVVETAFVINGGTIKCVWNRLNVYGNV